MARAPAPAEAKTTKRPKFVIPKTLGAVADLLYETRNARLALSRQVTELEERKSALKDHIIKSLPKSQATGVAGKLARVTIGKRSVPRVNDWDRFYAFVAKKKDFSLLQRRLTDAAIAERWEAGVEVPGVERFDVVTVGINKL